MSNSKNVIAEIKRLMKQYGFISDEAVLRSFKLEDNTIVEALELKVGESITRINDEFERVALEDGSYKLSEKFNVEVKDGKIATVKEIFVEAKLIDGTVVKVEGEGLVEGAAVKVVTEEMPDGVPAPDGSHELEDGTKIETKDGLIVSIQEKIAEEMEEVEVPVEVPAEIAPVAGEVVDAIIEAMMPLMDEVKVLVDEMKKMKDGMKSMENDFEAFKKAPAAKKIADGKTDFNKSPNSENDISDRIMALRKLNK